MGILKKKNQGRGTCQTRERELWHFDADFAASAQNVHRLDPLSDDDLRGHGDEVVVQRLRDERERARHAQVALDDFEHVVLGDQLHVEGTGHFQRRGDGFGDGSDLGQRFRVEILRRSHQSGVARVDAGVFHVLGNGQAQQLAVLRHSVNVDFLSRPQKKTKQARDVRTT